MRKVAQDHNHQVVAQIPTNLQTPTTLQRFLYKPGTVVHSRKISSMTFHQVNLKAVPRKYLLIWNARPSETVHSFVSLFLTLELSFFEGHLEDYIHFAPEKYI